MISYFLRYNFEILQVDNALWYRIYQWERSHKNLKIITGEVDFGIRTIEIFLNGKGFWHRVGVKEILHNLHINTQNFAVV